MAHTELVSFEVKKQDRKLIAAIVDRGEAMAKKANVYDRDHGRMGYEMDITACHANGCPLRLEKLLAADDFNFAHDFFGITRHIDRETGKLMNHFLPRCAA